MRIFFLLSMLLSCESIHQNPFRCYSGEEIAFNLTDSGKEQWCQFPTEKRGVGVRHGPYARWSNWGRLVEYRMYQMGTLDSIIDYYDIDKTEYGIYRASPQMIGHFFNGKPDGPFTIHDEDGAILNLANFRQGELVGNNEKMRYAVDLRLNEIERSDINFFKGVYGKAKNAEKILSLENESFIYRKKHYLSASYDLNYRSKFNSGLSLGFGYLRSNNIENIANPIYYSFGIFFSYQKIKQKKMYGIGFNNEIHFPRSVLLNLFSISIGLYAIKNSNPKLFLGITSGREFIITKNIFFKINGGINFTTTSTDSCAYVMGTGVEYVF